MTETLIAQVKVYKPGTPEFDAVASQVTHVSKMGRGISDQPKLIYAEVAPDTHRTCVRRRESTDKL